jgi:hypothetical protein
MFCTGVQAPPPPPRAAATAAGDAAGSAATISVRQPHPSMLSDPQPEESTATAEVPHQQTNQSLAGSPMREDDAGTGQDLSVRGAACCEAVHPDMLSQHVEGITVGSPIHHAGSKRHHDE